MNAQTPFTFAGFSFPRTVATLPKGKPASRLAAAKTRCTGPYYAAPVPNAGGAFFYLDSDFMPGLRWEWADEIEGARINHKGWFSDPYGDGETIRGIVFRLPKGRGFLAGWSMGEGMASEAESKIYADEIAAARAADSEAESVAEREREYQAAANAGREWAELGDEIAAARRKALAILKERRTVQYSTDDGKAPFALCEAIRDKVESLLSEIGEARTKRTALADGDGGDYVSFWPGEARLRDAFNENAGAVVIA